MRLLMGVFVSDMSSQHSTGGELCLAKLALVGFCLRVRVHMVLQSFERFEATLTHTARVGSLFTV